MFRLFEGNDHAALYKKYRRHTPKFLVDKILKFMQQQPEAELQISADPVPLIQAFDVAVDVGCGSGQHTLSLAPYFEHVYGFDISQSQITEALRHNNKPGAPGNVSYAVAPAEKLPLPDRSVQLVTGNFSFHWFDLEPFYAEVDRVLAPNGVVAAVGHTTMRVIHPTKNEELNKLLKDYVATSLNAKMHERNDYVFNLYRDLPLPYKEERRVQKLPLDINRTLADVLGAYSSWSSFQALYREDPQKMIAASDKFRDQFLRILDLDVSTPVEEVPLVLHYEYFVAMCRKPGVAT